ncbi:lipoprotein [Aquabacterium sp. NJ1]|uniref:hypothetical protein n=1 Tax=Aquabacterium sp. NJ1 TaxID=1538295 RepID=UPI00052E4126|nr:hypothetical protein [Aquabacterium sp. NJ1]KGM40148.1 lipoprotein [Aquabacterium sp. NJ1]
MKSRFPLNAAMALLAACPSLALACSSCGCTLNADWASQGLTTRTGLSVDLRYDYFKQDELRTGTGRFDAAQVSYPADQEIQQKTANRNTTLTLDYGLNADWGISLQLPYINRYHETIVDGDTDVSTSRSSAWGDARVLGRYQGFSPERNWGVQFGLKLPTGKTSERFNGGPQAGEALDRGLQPGTGSTDLLLGLYRFGPLNQHFDYFAQGLLQVPVTAKDEFKPGLGMNLSAGVRYVSAGMVVPQLQLNARIEQRESGDNADVANSGATLVYLSPGATVNITQQFKLYGFFQVPVYQRVNGLQIEPRSSFSLGAHYNY